MKTPKAAVLIGQSQVPTLFQPEMLREIERLADVHYSQNPGRAPTPEEAEALITGAEIAICSWGSPAIDAALLERAPNLRHVIYAAGSVKPIVTPALLERGVVVTNGAGVIAQNVAETTLGYIIVGLKNAWRLSAETRKGKWRNTVELERVKELYGLTVGVVSAGFVGRAVLGLLSHFDVERLVYDPFLSEERAHALGARKATLEELLATADVVTLHAPNLPATRHLLNAENLRSLKSGALLVNTARGSLIDESALLERLQQGDIYACLDVTDPEPPTEAHPFRGLDNVMLTSHIAGGVSNGRLRLGRMVRDELRAYVNGEPPIYPVDLSNLDALA